LANFLRIKELFSKKIVTMLSKIWVWDPGSDIRDPGSRKKLFWIPDPAFRGQKGTGSRIRIHNTGAIRLFSGTELDKFLANPLLSVDGIESFSLE
jgi:hypothetical protein